MKIRGIKVRNYKSLFDTTVEDMGDVNLFYGYNNSGKSNVFKFLELVFRPKTFRDTLTIGSDTANVGLNNLDFWQGNIYDQPFIFSNNNRDNPIQYLITIEVDKNDIPHAKELNKHKLLSNDKEIFVIEGEIRSINQTDSSFHLFGVQLNGDLIFDNRDDKQIFFPGVKTQSFDKKGIGSDILAQFNNCILLIDTDRNFTKEKNSPVSSSNVLVNSKNYKSWLYELNLNADSYGRFLSLIEFFRRFSFSKAAISRIGSNYKSFPLTKADFGFSTFKDELEIMLSNDVGGRIPLKNYGTGIQQFVYILSRIFESDAKIIFIEELELNLSPIYQEELLAFLRSLMPKTVSQLNFSTHSPYFTHKIENIDYVQYVRLWDDKGTDIESHDRASIEKVSDPENPYNSYFYCLWA